MIDPELSLAWQNWNVPKAVEIHVYYKRPCSKTALWNYKCVLLSHVANGPPFLSVLRIITKYSITVEGPTNLCLASRILSRLKSVVINTIVFSAQEIKTSSERWKINFTLKTFEAIQQIALDKWSKIIGELLQPKASLL